MHIEPLKAFHLFSQTRKYVKSLTVGIFKININIIWKATKISQFCECLIIIVF